MSQQLVPFNDRVIIKPIEEDEQMYGTIVIPDLGKERPEMGEVIAVGPGRKTEYGQYIGVNAKVGDIVLVPKIGTIRIDFEGDEYFITPDKEILASIKKEENE
jgi:chaperonin GroES